MQDWREPAGFILTPTFAPRIYRSDKLCLFGSLELPTVEAINPTMTPITEFSFWFAVKDKTWRLVSLCLLIGIQDIPSFTFILTVSWRVYRSDNLCLFINLVLPTAESINPTMTLSTVFPLWFAMKNETWRQVCLCSPTATMDTSTFALVPRFLPRVYKSDKLCWIVSLVLPTAEAINPTMTIITAFLFWFSMKDETWRLVSLCLLTATMNIPTFTLIPTISPRIYRSDKLCLFGSLVLPTVEAIKLKSYARIKW